MVKTAGALMLERAQKLRARLKADDFEPHEWRQLVDDLRGCPLSDECRAAWDQVVEAFPSTAWVWVRYAEAELAAGNAGAVRDIFSRSLMACKSVELWSVYVRFIKKVNEGRGAEGVSELRSAYEFTLEHVGQDMHSGPLWLDFMSFLSGAKPGTQAYTALWTTGMVGGQEEATRAAALRRQYQRAISVPTHSLEALWKQYENFEMAQANKQLAPRIVAEQRPRFQAARMAYRERKRKLEGIDAAAWAVPPGKGGPQQEHQVRLWKAYLDSERSNPQRLDREQLQARVVLAYDQALMCLRCFPELWYDYSRWHGESGGGPDSSTAVLARAAAALPDCLLLHFALADAHEALGKAAEAKEVYENLVTQLEPLPAEPAAAAAAGAAGAAAAAAAATPAALVPQQQQKKKGEEGAKPKGGPLADLPEDQQALAWIQYMRFLRRSDLAASRRLFIRARRSPRCPWQVYAAAAAMEWRLSREEGVARKIFEKGLEGGCLTEPQYILQYVNFLREVGDPSNARALFERALTEDANRRSAALWERYLVLESESGDLQSALRLEKRAREALGLDGPGGGGGGAGGGAGGPGGGGGAGGGGGGGGAAAKGLQLQLLLLRYECLDLLPVAPSQKQYVQHLIGKGPPPPGFERRRGVGGPGGGVGGVGAGDGGSGGGGHQDGPDGVGGGPGPSGPPLPSGGTAQPPPPRAGATPVGGLFSGVLPWVVEDFLNRLPPPQLLDGPMPDVAVLVDAFMTTDFDSPAVRQALLQEPGAPPPAPAAAAAGGPGGAPRGVKREFEDEGGPAGGLGGGPGGAPGAGGGARDMYRMRVKQRARAASGADG